MALREFRLTSTDAVGLEATSIGLAHRPAEAIRQAAAVVTHLVAHGLQITRLDVIDVEIDITIWRWEDGHASR